MKWGMILVASGATALLLNLAYPPLAWGMLVWVALVPLFRLAERPGGQRFLAGWLAGTLTHAFGYGWIFFTIRDFGGLSPTLSAVGALLFWLYQGLDLGIWLGLGPRFFKTGPFWFRAFGMAGWWLILQTWLFPYIFPANYGAALAGVPLFGMGAALWSGKGVTFWIIAFQAFLALPKGPSWSQRTPWVMAVFLLPLLGLAIPRNGEADLWRIGVVQPNLIPWAKQGGMSGRQIFAAHDQPTSEWKEADLDLVVWPETAVPFDLRQAESYAARLSQLATELDAAVVTGAVGVFGPDNYSNEIWLFLPGGSDPVIYQKQRLVLFSERLPWILSWATYFDSALGGFRPGQNDEGFKYRDRVMLPLVCFEALFPGDTRKDAGHLILNLTNDAWFGESKASALHLQHIRLRSVESGAPLVRATNSGISCWVDVRGEIHQATPLYEEAAVIFQVPVPKQPPFRLDRWGEGLIALLSLTFVGVALGRAVFHRFRFRSGAA